MLNLIKKIVAKNTKIDYTTTVDKIDIPNNDDIDFIINTIENSKLDVVYIEQINLRISQDERLYLIGQMDKLNKSIKILKSLKLKG